MFFVNLCQLLGAYLLLLLSASVIVGAGILLLGISVCFYYTRLLLRSACIYKSVNRT